MSEADLVKKILTPFLIHGICKDEAEALRMLAAEQVAALCQGVEEIPALGHLDRREQIVRAEDDL